jgi:hypothetical protein
LQHASEADNAGIFHVIEHWLQIQARWKSMRTSDIYPDVPWDQLEVIHSARLDKQTYEIHWVAHALRPDRSGPGSKLPPSVFDSVRRYLAQHMSKEELPEAIREFTRFRLKSGSNDDIFNKDSVVYDDTFSPAMAWRCLQVQGSVLSKVAVRVLDTLANSVPSERSFSANNHIHTKERNRLAMERADQQCFCYMNSRVLYCLKNPLKQGQKRWADLEEKDWMDLEDIYLDMFLN